MNLFVLQHLKYTFKIYKDEAIQKKLREVIVNTQRLPFALINFYSLFFPILPMAVDFS